MVTSRGTHDQRRAQRAVTHRLRAEAEAAWQTPSPDLRQRTLAALTDSAAPDAAQRDARPTQLLRLAACIALAAVAGLALLGRPDAATEPPMPVVVNPSFDTLFADHLRELETPWEQTLGDEARHLVDDARLAGQVLLAQLPWGQSLTRP